LTIILIAYFSAFFTDHTQTHIEKVISSNPNQLVQFSLSKFDKQCQFCNYLKFERSSHCSTCKACIPRRDHHCPWLGKCVGYANTQYFFNYILWLAVAGYFYFSGFINYYNTMEIKIKNDPSLEVSTFSKFFIYTWDGILFSGTFGACMLILIQINCIFNEISFNERRKSPNNETYYLCCVPKVLNEREVIKYF
jgi:hypothetical protein